MPERTQIQDTKYKIQDTKEILGYEPLFDIQAYQDLTAKENLLSPQEFSRRKTQLDMRTTKNLETMLGERFNVEISRVIYRIRNNQIISFEHDEPFLDVIRRGQRYRQENGSDDVTREIAEVEGFERLQQIIAMPDNTVSSEANLNKSEADDTVSALKAIIISPRGRPNSIYQHNFLDVYEKKGNQVIMTRYTTTASYDQSRQAADKIDPFNNLSANPTDADFLKTPLVTYRNINGILALFPPDDGVIARRDLEKIQSFCAQIIINYTSNPSYLTFNALLNFADRIAKAPRGSDPQLDRPIKPFEIAQVISHLGYLPVRQVSAGCGLQGGFLSIVSGQLSIVNLSPFSVAEFAFPNQINSSEDKSDFPCPRCGYIITYGAGIKKCPGCDLEATCA